MKSLQDSVAVLLVWWEL